MIGTINQLLEAHRRGVDQVGPVGLPEALGDAHLCAKHPIYRRIRKLALADGVRFSCTQDVSLRKIYDVVPLLCLQSILEEKVIPYRDNVCGLLSLPEDRQMLPRGAQFLATSPAVNPILHETSHFIAHARRLFRTEDFPNLRSDTAWVAQQLASEAYANTVELFSLANVRGPIDAVFLFMNSYMSFDPGRARVLKAAIRERGAICTFVACGLLFCARNLGDHRTLPPYARSEIEAFFGFDFCVRTDWLKQLATIVRLTPGFTDTTTPLYLSLYLSEGSSRRALSALRVNAGAFLRALHKPFLAAAQLTLQPTA